MLPNWTKDRTTQLEMLEEKGENRSLKVEPSLNIDKETQKHMRLNLSLFQLYEQTRQ